MSEHEDPKLKSPDHVLHPDDVRALTYGTTPHFALQTRNRLRRLTANLPTGDPARQLAELEIKRLETLAVEGEHGPHDLDLVRLSRELSG